MPKKKKQHFVPQFYMRNFSTDNEKKLVSIFHLGTGKRIDNVPAKDQNYGDYFYGKDGKLEDSLGILESGASNAISKIIAEQKLPERFSEDAIALHLFSLFQANRTPAAAAELNESWAKAIKEILKEEPALKDDLDDVTVEFANAPATALKLVAEMVTVHAPVSDGAG